MGGSRAGAAKPAHQLPMVTHLAPKFADLLSGNLLKRGAYV